MKQLSTVSTSVKTGEITWQIEGYKRACARCESMWTDAVRRQDLQTMQSLRCYIAFMQARVLTKKSNSAGRQEWLAWLQLRCSLVIRRNRF